MRIYENENEKVEKYSKDGFINQLFGTDTSLTKAKFVELIQKPKFKWIFD